MLRLLMRYLALLASLTLLAGCVSAPSRDVDLRSSAQVSHLDTLLDRHAYTTVVDEAQALRKTWPAGDMRARVSLAEARALAGLQRTGSAMLAFDRARADVEQPDGALVREILRAWGDAELKAGRPRPAARRYEQAFERAPDGSRESDELCLSVAVALDAVGSRMADSWRRRIRRPSSSAMARLEQRLVASQGTSSTRPPVRPVASSGAGAMLDARSLLPGLKTRAQWRAAPIRGNHDAMTPIWRITVHHGATRFTSTSESAAASELRDTQRFHQQDRKWADLAYHFCIDPAGRVWEGRSLRHQGAHAGNPDLNRGNVGIMLLGNFNEQSLGASQQRALAQTLARLSDRLGVQRGHVYTHNEVRPGHTECPGRALQAWMDRYRGGSFALASRQ